jgi:putative membrane-bound dehydrogenase-like protein
MLRLILCFGIVAIGHVAPVCAQDRYQVGVAKVDITPNYPVRLNGFGHRRDESTGVSQRLWAKAIAISHGESAPAVIVTCDNLGVREWLVDQVADEIGRRHQLPRENIALTFTHTHCAPKVRGASDTIFSSPIPDEHQAHIDRYTEELKADLIDVIDQAIAHQKPATLAWTVGKVTFAQNRRTPGGPVDHGLPVLLVRGEDGRPRAILATYACHCVTLSYNQIHGDWAGFAQEYIEKEFPDCVAMMSIGCGSDANPESGVTGDNLVAASDQGRAIADEVERLLAEPLRELDGPMTARLEHVALPLNDRPSREQLEARAREATADGYNAKSQLAKLDAGQELLSEINYPIQSVRFGDDLLMVFLAGEICVDYAIRLREVIDRDRLWLHGYSNDFCGYIPSERLLQEGGYGGGSEINYFDLPATLRTGVEQKIVDAVIAHAPEKWLVKPGTQGVPPKSPDDSLRCMRTHDDLQIELVAAEPLVSDPVAIDFGTDGRLWVAEMADYTREVHDEFDPRGRVRILTDDDNDGRFDRATDFLDRLRFPTDVKVWRDGVLICDAPDILFAADRDGDGRAEIREVRFTGFATHNPHGRVNGLRFGLDGWVYGSGGLFGGTIKNKHGLEVDIQNRDFRIKPDEGIIEGAMGVTQQGRPRDDWDNWFGCTNSQLLLHYPLRQEYTRRNPHVILPPTIVSVPDETHREQLFPPEDLVLFKLSGAAGRPTSACGAEIYRDTYLGNDYYGNAFVCEPVNQLVHRMVLKPKGCTFTGSRHPSEASSEFLTSTDRWFRPVQARTGPDGALWIVDMYRYVIEHPRWIPPETIQELDVMAGQGMGRIYRVVRRDSPAPRPLKLDSLSDDDLAQAIDSTNGVQRDLAEQMLIWRKPKDAPLELELILRWGKTPAARIQAASTLASLNALSIDQAKLILKDDSSDVRRLGVQFAEPLIRDSQSLATDIVRLAKNSDSDQAIVAQVANSMGNSEALSSHLVTVAAHSFVFTDPYAESAILSSINEQNAVEWFRIIRQRVDGGEDHLFRSLRNDSRIDGAFAFQLAKVAALSARSEDLREFLHLIVSDAASDGIFTGGNLSSTESSYSAVDWLYLASVLDAIESRNQRLTECIDPAEMTFLTELVRSAYNCLHQEDLAIEHRLAAIKLMGREFEPDVVADSARLPEQLMQLTASRFSPEIQSAALNAVLRCQPTSAPEKIIAHWNNFTPSLRQEAVDLFFTRDDWASELVGGVERQVINIGDFDATQRQRLLEHPNADLRARAEKLFGAVAAPNELVTAWEPALKLSGDIGRGKAVYAKVCSSCHILDGVGFEVGPDVAALTNRTAEALLVAILDPNREVDGRYLSYTALKVDGKTVSGLLVAETATSVTLREQGGKDHVILRTELDELRTSRKSVMPEGIEKDLDHQAMADLIAYVLSDRGKN